MKNKNIKKEYKMVEEGINAVSGILSVIHPVFSTVPLIIFGINRVVDFVKSDDIINRIKTLENKLLKNKIDLTEFKEKMNNLSEHERYVISNNLNNILLNCIPETVEIYISVFIEYVMNKEHSFEEDLFEIIGSLNASDIKVLNNIKEYMDDGIRETYQESIRREKYINKLNEEVESNNKIAHEKNKIIEQGNKHLVKYIDDMPKFSENNERFGEYTIFWKDFAIAVGLEPNITISKLLLFDYYNSDYSKWTYMARSFIKLDKLGIIEMETLTTLGTINSLNIERFHLTNYCLEILSYME